MENPYQPGDLRHTLCALVDGLALMSRVNHELDAAAHFDREARPRCGNCSHWMTDGCPAERHERGRRRGPSMNGVACGLFVEDGGVQRLRDMAERHRAEASRLKAIEEKVASYTLRDDNARSTAMDRESAMWKRVQAIEAIFGAIDENHVRGVGQDLLDRVSALETARGESRSPTTTTIRPRDSTPEDQLRSMNAYCDAADARLAREAELVVVDAARAWSKNPTQANVVRLDDAVRALPPPRPAPGGEWQAMAKTLTDPRPLYCTGCGAPFWTRKSLEMHMDSEHPLPPTDPAEPSAAGEKVSADEMASRLSQACQGESATVVFRLTRAVIRDVEAAARRAELEELDRRLEASGLHGKYGFARTAIKEMLEALGSRP